MMIIIMLVILVDVDSIFVVKISILFLLLPAKRSENSWICNRIGDRKQYRRFIICIVCTFILLKLIESEQIEVKWAAAGAADWTLNFVKWTLTSLNKYEVLVLQRHFMWVVDDDSLTYILLIHNCANMHRAKYCCLAKSFVIISWQLGMQTQ